MNPFPVNHENRKAEAKLVASKMDGFEDTWCVWGEDTTNYNDVKHWFINSFYTSLYWKLETKHYSNEIVIEFDLNKGDKSVRSVIMNYYRFLKGELYRRDKAPIDCDADNTFFLTMKNGKLIHGFVFPLVDGWHKGYNKDAPIEL
jgi:hypothetical protein